VKRTGALATLLTRMDFRVRLCSSKSCLRTPMLLLSRKAVATKTRRRPPYHVIIIAKTSACNVDPRADSHLVGRNVPSPGAAMHDCSYAFGDRHCKVSSLRLLSTTSSLQKLHYSRTSEPHPYSWLLRSPQSRHRLCLQALALPLEYESTATCGQTFSNCATSYGSVVQSPNALFDNWPYVSRTRRRSRSIQDKSTLGRVQPLVASINDLQTKRDAR
jgi:hypothetical protein